MVKKKRHTARFKSIIAIEAIKECKTLNELASQYGVYPAQISEWKKQLLNGSEGVFYPPQKNNNIQQKKLDELHRIVGEITVHIVSRA